MFTVDYCLDDNCQSLKKTLISNLNKKLGRKEMNDVLLLVTEIMGKKVKTKEGQEIGVVQNIMINPKHTRIDYIILCYADFIGKTHRHFVIPNDMMVLKRDIEKMLFFEIDQQKLSNIYRLDIDDEVPITKMSQQIYEIDQDAPQFSYQSFF